MIKPCFDPNSSICQGCLMSTDPMEEVMYHITHLEKDHGIRIDIQDNGYLSITPKDIQKIRELVAIGHHI